MKRTFDSDTVANGKKKVKFEQETSFFAAEGQDDEDLEFGARKRKGAIKQGYTDSDDEDAGGVSDDSDGEDDKKDAEGAEDDMFAEKKDKFLSKDKIDNEGAEKSQEQEMMPFNMDDELDEGAFDENFNYVKTVDEHEVHDKWLGGITNDDMKIAKNASDRIKARADALDALEEGVVRDEDSCWKAVLALMKPRESVTGALKRLGGPKKVPAWKKNLKKKVADAAPKEADETPESEAERKKNLSELISLTDQLTSFNRYDVMEQTYESIARALRISGHLPDSWQPGDAIQSTTASSTQSLLWEYKTGDESDPNAVIHGPVTAKQMREFTNSNESGMEPKAVFVRLVKQDTPTDPLKGFVSIRDVDFETGLMRA
ncbi:CD2 antigen cytoplasmic tail-binding protein 2 [Podochytrium sp. JEL0797]|nr:CD2 antigen cytoplasmic tail-binding protein 2 [Podochytrium sp. JEL0797]